MTIRVVMAGATGWVGRAMIPVIAAQSDMALAGAVARNAAGQDSGSALGLAPNGTIVAATLADALAAPSDVVVDYTKPDVVKANTLLAIENGRHVVIGTSGLGADDFAEIDKAARAKGVGVLAAGNFSITATLMKRFALMAAKYVPDVEIIDYASAKKPDAPSGTARELAETLAAVRGASTARPVADVLGVPGTRGAAVGAGTGVQVHSLRLPSYILSCEALFGLPDERLTIRHDAGSSAAPYVAGTLLAIREVGKIKGLVRGLDALME
jgi:4-hydroxy-tetrahydrodipicolinate reductase